MDLIKEVPPAKITESMTRICQKWIEEGFVKSHYDVNSGSCFELVRRVLTDLRTQGYSYETLEDVELASFMVYDTTHFDVPLLEKHWPNVVPPHGLSWAQIDELSEQMGWREGIHGWLAHKGLHYDAECLEGTPNFFDLPIFRRCIQHYLLPGG